METKKNDLSNIQSNEWTFEDLKTLRSAIDHDSKEGGKSPRPLPSACASCMCTK
jgi:hypothetical protein